MAVFTKEEIGETLDWAILRDGGVSLYHKRTYLDEDIAWLTSRRYLIYPIDCASWVSSAAMHDSLKQVLEFPDYYGRNFDALNDCLRDIDVPLDGGAAVLLDRFDLYAHALGTPTSERHDAKVLLGIFARASREALLSGRRFITLVQSDDPRMHFEGLAPVHAQWNWREWLMKNRGL
jgi:hypothetical protein